MRHYATLESKRRQKVEQMKGYKGFNKGLVCRGYKFNEGETHETERAEVCKSGFHFCAAPFDVLDHYGFVGENAELNEFAEVEALGEALTADEKKYCTKKIKIGAKLGIAGLVNAQVGFIFEKVNFSESAATNTGDYSAATNTGDYSAATNTGYMSAATNTGYMSAATNTGDYSAATNTGDYSAATVEGKNSFAIATGIDGKAKGKKGCYIAVAEWKCVFGNWLPIDFKAAKVDGVKIKEDVFYILKNGEFVETE